MMMRFGLEAVEEVDKAKDVSSSYGSGSQSYKKTTKAIASMELDSYDLIPNVDWIPDEITLKSDSMDRMRRSEGRSTEVRSRERSSMENATKGRRASKSSMENMTKGAEGVSRGSRASNASREGRVERFKARKSKASREGGGERCRARKISGGKG
ncbi:hypothetical protein RJT34_16860 [Clitoria ternatea]|uniref:Uncharacterized protein n=1 Tax=Clitoria ternatea TaxID=43366 RepID=A0AAN9J859_CLITE